MELSSDVVGMKTLRFGDYPKLQGLSHNPFFASGLGKSAGESDGKQQIAPSRSSTTGYTLMSVHELAVPKLTDESLNSI